MRMVGNLFDDERIWKMFIFGKKCEKRLHV